MSILRELVGDVDREKEKRIQKAKADFAFFCQYYLRDAFPLPFGQYQNIIIDIVNNRAITPQSIKAIKPYIKPEHHDYIRPSKRLEGILCIEPRDHGKSTRMSKAFPLWLALTRQQVFPVIVGASKEKACDFLDYIKYELENNERIYEDFGDMKGRIWKQNKIVLTNNNTIGAVGAAEAIRGMASRTIRPTHIICDDLLKDNEVGSKTSREKLYKWFKRVIMNLGKDALVVIVNTIMHPDDLPSRLLAEIKEGTKLKGWIGLRFSAITPEGKPLWPQRWSLKDIEKKKTDLGSHIFATEWENEPMPEEERKFRKEWFQGYEAQDIRNMRLKNVMAVDPATGKDTGDYSAVVIAGRADNGQIYVLDADGERVSDMKLIAKIIAKYRAYQPVKIVFEVQAFQEIYKNQILREAMREGLVLPIKGIKHTVSKEFRISKLSPLVEAGIIVFQKDRQRLLLEQLEEFPKGHDDLPDALEMAVTELIVNKRPEPLVFPMNINRDTKAIFRGYGK